MGFQESRWSGANYVTVTTSSANTTNPITSACILEKITLNAAPTSAFLIYDGSNASGTLVATIAASTAVGTHFDYGIRLNGGVAVSAQSSDTNIVISYIPVPKN